MHQFHQVKKSLIHALLNPVPGLCYVCLTAEQDPPALGREDRDPQDKMANQIGRDCKQVERQ